MKLKHTWLFYLNYLLLQFFFMRLARVMDDNNGEVINGVAKLKQIGWTIKFWLPFTNWKV